MRRAAATLPWEGGEWDGPSALQEGFLSPDVRLGAVLASAILSCDLRSCETQRGGGGDNEGDEGGGGSEHDELGGDQRRNFGDCMLGGPPLEPGAPQMRSAAADDAMMAAAAAISLREVRRACSGLSCSASMTAAATLPLSICASLLRGAAEPPQAEIALLAAAANDCPGAKEQTGEFASLLHMWQLLKLDPSLECRRLETGPKFVLALLSTRCAPETSRAFERRLRLLESPGPRISGRAVAALAGLPPAQRSAFICQLHVLCRLRGEAPLLRTTQELEAYLEGECGGLLGRLRAVWSAGVERLSY